MGEDSGEKTEEPTPHKLREARKKGNIAKSKDLTTAFLLLISFHSLKFFGVAIWEHLTVFYRESFYLFTEELTGAMAQYVLFHAMMTFFYCMAPLLAANLITVLVLEYLQVGFIFSFESVSPKLTKLNPIEGFKKYFQLKQYIELLKSVVKMFFVILIIISSIKKHFFMVILSQQLQLWQVVAFTGELVMDCIVKVGLFYLLIALFDYFYQRYEYLKGLKMSKKEIKDEYKRLEGDPLIKQRQREAQRRMSEGRQMGSVPGADVVVTNPTHFAVAIQYSPNFMDAPIVVAKGKNLIAADIRKLAEQYYIPVIENPPLTRALYQDVSIGSEIPEKYFQLVAEILAFVYNLKKKRQQLV